MESKMFDNFIGLYPVEKTLRFELIPQGKTKENIEKDGILEEDELRAENYEKVKSYIDGYHKVFIERVLSKISLEGLAEYEELYNVRNKSDDQKKDIEGLEEKMRKQISGTFKYENEYEKLFKKEMVAEILPQFLESDADKEITNEFSKFTTYFSGFNENRKNIYSADKKATAIGYRIINENLPIFLDNINQFKHLKETSLGENIEIDNLDTDNIDEVFQIGFFNNVLNQTGITKYNNAIGKFNSDINEYNQKHSRKERVGKFKKLYKQILSDRESLLPIQDKFNSDQETINAVESYVELLESESVIEKTKLLLSQIDVFDLDKVYIKNDNSIREIAKTVFGSWDTIQRALENDYDGKHLGKKRNLSYEKYEEKRSKEIKKIDSYSIKQLNNLVEMQDSVTSYFKNTDLIFEKIMDSSAAVRKLVEEAYPENKNLKTDDDAIQCIKNYLDAVKKLQRIIEPLLGSGNEADKDERFYGELSAIWDTINLITPLYNKVRNYVTQKPYSTEKIKLNFKNPELLSGWAKSREKTCYGLIFRNGQYYYLGIMKKGVTQKFKEYAYPENPDDKLEKMEYLQVANPAKDIQNLMVEDGKTVMKKGRKKEDKNVLLEEYKNKYLPYEINRIRKKGSYKTTETSFKKEDLTAFIDYYKERIIEYKPEFTFCFKKSEEYASFKEFTDHINEQAYQLRFVNVSKKYIEKLVEEGSLYLFKIYNKDFSPYSKGTPNLHTLYWRMIFDEKNLKDVVYKLNGNAEIFFRKASIDKKDMIVHPANIAIENKNIKNEKKTSKFSYDIIKDKRYTLDKFQFHVPITMNFKSQGLKNINEEVNQYLKDHEMPYVIGVDRGERNLLYIVVINPDGEIVEQFSLNEIISEHNGNKYRTDYHALLDQKEGKRDQKRKQWKTIENIKDLKEGYLSQVIYKITEMMRKYNAVLVLENLKMGFKRSRQKVEKQVYQKFEKMLINKLNYLTDKKIAPEKNGGLLRAYQLTNKFDSFNKLGTQTGFLFYIPAWNTSKMDPTTGFVNFFYERYESVEKSKSFWEKFDNISYNTKEGYFEFAFDYSKFTTRAEGSRLKWTACSYGKRINNFRNPEKDNHWDYKEVNLTNEMKEVFDKYDINLEKDDLKEQFVQIDSKYFHQNMMNLFRLMVKMRNSVTNSSIDYMISPIKNKSGKFYFSEDASEKLPKDADANGAYNIARKGLWAVERIKKADAKDLKKIKLNISNKEWLKYAQENLINE